MYYFNDLLISSCSHLICSPQCLYMAPVFRIKSKFLVMTYKTLYNLVCPYSLRLTSCTNPINVRSVTFSQESTLLQNYAFCLKFPCILFPNPITIFSHTTASNPPTQLRKSSLSCYTIPPLWGSIHSLCALHSLVIFFF